MHTKLAMMAASVLLVTGSPFAAAQQQNAQQGQGGGGGSQANVPPVSQWDYSQLYQQGGVSGEALLEADVIGRNNEERSCERPLRRSEPNGRHPRRGWRNLGYQRQACRGTVQRGAIHPERRSRSSY